MPNPIPPNVEMSLHIQRSREVRQLNTTTVEYEWDAELYDLKHFDVDEHHHCPTIADAINIVETYPAPEGMAYRLVLVRDVFDEGGVVDRRWAYAREGERLQFDRPTNRGVPKMYQREYMTHLAQIKELELFDKEPDQKGD